MARIRLTKEFSFESAHTLDGYDGLCREIHGHSYRLFVTIIGTPSAEPSDPKFGMVMDFGELKRIVNREIIEPLDHSFVLRDTPRNREIEAALGASFEKVVRVAYQPTCENMLGDFAARLQAALPERVSLHSLRLHETASSYAEWFAEDND